MIYLTYCGPGCNCNERIFYTLQIPRIGTSHSDAVFSYPKHPRFLLEGSYSCPEKTAYSKLQHQGGYSLVLYIYIYIFIHRQTVSLCHNSSVWLDTLGASSSATKPHTSAQKSQRFRLFTFCLYIYIWK